MQTIDFEKQLDNMISFVYKNNTNELENLNENNIKDINDEKIGNILFLSKNDDICKMVSSGIQISGAIKKLTSDLKNISDYLKFYAKVRIEKYNKDNFDDVKSARIKSNKESSVLVTIKSVNKVDKESILKCKNNMDLGLYNTIFEEKETYTIKEQFCSKVIILLKKIMGNDFVDNSFSKSVQICLKDKNKFNEFINNENIDENLRKRVKDSVKISEISITY